ncbi:MAG: hypothetical protein IJ461_02985, partial [Clostridia bacterium]|nr:hypothetical protein [Clostridia bacterium]
MKIKKRVLSMLMAICLVVGLMPVTAFAAGDTGKAIQLGTSGISGYDSTNGYDYIYMGYWTAQDGNTTSGPIKWRVLDDQTNTGASGLFLLSDVLLDSGVMFDDGVPSSNEWQGSNAQAWCKDFAGINGSSVTDAFTAAELAAILATTANDTAYGSFSASDNILNGDRVFFLSAKEAENANYGFVDHAARVANYGGAARAWWLRSPYSIAEFVSGVVGSNGWVDTAPANNSWAARPAFNLNLSSVLFTSAANNSGHNSSFAAPADYSGNEWKVTVKDDNDFSDSASFTGTTALVYGYSDTTLKINHAALSTLSADYTNVTAMLTNSSGNILYYGSINETTSATESTVTIPAGLAAGEYTLSVYGEDWNGANYTDYA